MSSNARMDRDRLISAREIEGLVADGQLIVIHQGLALKLDSWIHKHPGGHLAIHHMVGRDATDEINVLSDDAVILSYPRTYTNLLVLLSPLPYAGAPSITACKVSWYHFEKTLKVMSAYRIGRVQLPWTNLEPPIRGGVHRKLHEAQLDDESDRKSDADLILPADTDSATEDAAEDVSSLFSTPPFPLSSSNSSIGHEEDEAKAASVGSLPLTAPFPTDKLTRETYTAALEQKEIADGVRNYPSLDPETQEAIRAEYKALHKLVQEQGHYNCRYSEYGKEGIRYALLFCTFLYLVHIEWYMTSACFLGMFWQQIMFVAHDAGHRGITGDFITDTIIGAFVADFCNGLSIGWWKSSHNVHHLVTNMPEHDPDNQNVPLFATSPSYFKSVYSSFYKFRFVWDKAADVLVPWQKYSYYPIMCIARFNLYLLSWQHLLSPRASQLGSAWWTRYLEVAFMACFWAIFGYGFLLRTLPDWPTRVGFVLISHSITMLLHVQITLSHWGMPTADLGPTESFPQRQLRTTMDVNCPEWLDFFHGGLQFQAVHHLFPRVPRHNLRRCQKLVREFCEKTNIKYQCHGFVDGNKVMLSRLEEVANMVETLVQCQTHMAETGHYHIE